jgi:hypothetical protein
MSISGSSSDIEEQAATGQTAPAFAGAAALRHAARLRAWLGQALFRQTAGGPIGVRKVLAALAFVIVGAAISLSRTRGPGALNTIWIEDAGNFLEDALHQSVMTTLTTQMNGYYDLVPRSLTAIAVLFPLRWTPAVMSIFAAMQYAVFGLIAYIASGPHLRSRWLRLLIAVPVCLVPLGYTQANNDLATVQFVALYGTFWLLLWIPATRGGRVVSPLIMLGVTLSSILPLCFAPLVAARLFVDRTKSTIFMCSFWLLGLVAQESVALRGLSNRHSGWYTSPVWVLEKYITRTVPRAIFGERALGGPGTNAEGMPVPLHIPNHTEHLILIAVAWVVLLAVIVIALARVTDPHWPLAVTAGLFSVIIFLGEIVDNLKIVQPRYVIAPALLLYVAVVALLRPRRVVVAAEASQPAPTSSSPRTEAPGPAWMGGPRSPVTWYPVAAFAIVLAIVCALNFRVSNTRSSSPPWSSVVARAQLYCERPGVTSYEYAHAWWRVHIPCSRVSRPSAK